MLITRSEDEPYRVGHKRPPLETRFKKGNQAARKRKKPPEDPDMVIAIARALSEEIGVTKNGRAKKITVMQALVSRLISQALTGSAKDQLALLSKLSDWGLLDVVRAQQELEAERREQGELIPQYVIDALDEIDREFGEAEDAKRPLWKALLRHLEGCTCCEKPDEYEQLVELVKGISTAGEAKDPPEYDELDLRHGWL